MKSFFRNQAKIDIKQAALWYDKQKKGLGKEFTISVRNKIKELRLNPEITQVRYLQIHTALINKFPYMIHYYIDESINAIIIFGVLHTSRNPDNWIEQIS